MDAYHFLLGDERTVQVPWWWFGALMVYAGVIGLVLWLFGRQLVKPMFALVLAGVAMLLAALTVRYFSQEMPLTWWLVAAGVVGAAMGWLLARLAVAVVFALALGVLVPTAVLAVQGTPLPNLAEPVAEAIAELREAAAEAVVVEENEEHGEEQTRIDAEKLPSLSEAYGEARAAVGETWGAWWDERPGATRLIVLSAAGAAVVIGGALTFVVPNLVGALMTAALGVALMIGPVTLGLAHLPAGATAWLPREGWPLAILLVLTVLLGALIQWSIFRPRRGED